MKRTPTMVTRICLPKPPYDAEYIAVAFKAAAKANGWTVDRLNRETDVPVFCVYEYHYGDVGLAKDIRCKNAYAYEAHIEFGGREMRVIFDPMTDGEKRNFVGISLTYGGEAVEPDSAELFIAFWDTLLLALPPF
jgi:hypothetical protein